MLLKKPFSLLYEGENLTGTGMKARLSLLEGCCSGQEIKEEGERLKYEERREEKGNS